VASFQGSVRFRHTKERVAQRPALMGVPQSEDTNLHHDDLARGGNPSCFLLTAHQANLLEGVRFFSAQARRPKSIVMLFESGQRCRITRDPHCQYPQPKYSWRPSLEP